MNNNDKKEFTKLLWMFANDAGVSISKEQLSIKYEMLKIYPIEQVSKAAYHLVQNREKTWPAIPAISEFVKVIESTGPKSLQIEERAEMQAAIVLKKLKYEGRNGKIDFEDKITKMIMTDRWNYNTWASTVREDQITWWKKDFVILYKSYENHDKAGMLLESDSNEFKKLVGGITEKITI